MFEHAVEPVRNGQFDFGFRTDAIQFGAFEEVHFFTEDLQVFRLEVGVILTLVEHSRTSASMYHLSLFACHRDAVMTIHHKIYLPDFI